MFVARFNYEISTEALEDPLRSPDRDLLAAVIERALRDLTETVPLDDTKLAIKWILNTPTTLEQLSNKTYLTFEDCVVGLDLPECAIAIMKVKALNAREALDTDSPRAPQKFHKKRVTR